MAVLEFCCMLNAFVLPSPQFATNVSLYQILIAFAIGLVL
jgi:hypothetical protein